VKICFACGGQKWFVNLMAGCLPAAPLVPIHAYARVPRAQVAGKLRRRDSLQLELLRSCWLPLWLVGCFDARVGSSWTQQGKGACPRPARGTTPRVLGSFRGASLRVHAEGSTRCPLTALSSPFCASRGLGDRVRDVEIVLF
jgi:hypothetical protein